jgi:N6-adenosine-specific RNA methylase IME4
MIGALQPSVVGLQLPDDLSFEDWQNIGRQLQFYERAIMWHIGDWLRYGERKWGERYAQAIEDTGYSAQSLMDSRWVAQRIEFSRRRENLSWSHHKEVAALHPSVADSILDEAEANGWNRREVRLAVSRAKTVARLPVRDGGGQISDLVEFAKSGPKCGTIYADPPWLYANQGTRAATGNHYGGMTVEELCALPVGDIAANDAHLHLWTTNAFLFECPRIFEAWGFEFRSSFVWVKSSMGIGNYWRNSHEFLLTAIRGNAKRFYDRSLVSWLECDRGHHSSKPEQVRHFIEKASPGPNLELFARSTSPGWLVWGNDVRPNLFDAAQREVA